MTQASIPSTQVFTQPTQCIHHPTHVLHSPNFKPPSILSQAFIQFQPSSHAIQSLHSSNCKRPSILPTLPLPLSYSTQSQPLFSQITHKHRLHPIPSRLSVHAASFTSQSLFILHTNIIRPLRLSPQIVKQNIPFCCHLPITKGNEQCCHDFTLFPMLCSL